MTYSRAKILMMSCLLHGLSGTGLVHAESEAVADAANEPAADSTDATGLLTEWDIGLGLGYFNYQLYPGAKNTNHFVIPAPYFVYRSPVFEIDRGIKSFLYDSEQIVLDISADFGLPVDSDDTQMRQGMPDLDLVLQAGFSLEFLLNGRNNYFDTRFELPLRTVFSVSPDNFENIGYVFEPRLTFNHQRNRHRGVTHKTTIGIKYASREFHQYYYDVAPQYVTADRQTYTSDAGFGGVFVNYRISYRTERFVYWLIARYQSLNGAVFEDSPLVINSDYYFAGVGFSWIFASSEF
jgi:outer membrane protein